MIITCPNCHTKYQVADNAIGSAGRKVACANCHQSWQAFAEPPEEEKPRPKPKLVSDNDTPQSKPDTIFDAEQEAELDKAFEAAEREAEDWGEEEASPDEAADDAEASEEDEDPHGDDAEGREQRISDLRRQRRQAWRSPLTRARRMLRLAGVLTLLGIAGGGIWFRTALVQAFPDLGGLYASVGLGVNVVGLTFTHVETLRTLKDGTDVMLISAKIENVSNQSRRVPPVLVSILDDKGMAIYQWQARAQADTVGLGEAVAFETQLNSAPAGATQVKLVFVTNSASGTGRETHGP